MKRTKFTSVMMLIIESLESLLVLQNCSANIYFLFVIYLRNSGELKCTDLYRVIEYTGIETPDFLSQTNTLKIVYLKRKKGNEIPTGGADLLQIETD